MDNPRVRVPQIKDIKAAIVMYYAKTDLSSSDIVELFGVGRSRAAALKCLARDKMRELNVMPYNTMLVRTKIAYEAWGLDITDLEKRYAKLQTMGGSGMTETEQKIAYDAAKPVPVMQSQTYNCCNCKHPICRNKGKDPQRICGNYR